MSHTRLLRIALAAIVLAAASSPPLSARLVDRIMAVVNGEIIAQSDVEKYKALFAPDRDADSVLETIIDQKLLLAEARKFEIAAPSEDRIDREARRMADPLGGDAALSALLRRLSIPEDRFRQQLGAHLMIADLLDQRINSFVFVSNQEAEDYLRTHAGQFEGWTAEEALPEVTRILTRQKTETRKGEYLDRLRNRARIQIN